MTQARFRPGNMSSYEVSLIKAPPQKCILCTFLPFSTLSRQNPSFHQKSNSMWKNFLPNSVFFYFQISILIFLNSKKPCIKGPLLGASTVMFSSKTQLILLLKKINSLYDKNIYSLFLVILNCFHQR